MNPKIILGFCLILFLSTVFAAAPTVTAITITPYITTDKNYIDFPITMYTTASGDINANSACWYKVSTGGTNFAGDWNSDTNRCTVAGYSSAGVDDFNFVMIVSNKARDANATTPVQYVWRDNNAPRTSYVTSTKNIPSTVTVVCNDAATNTGSGVGCSTTYFRQDGGAWQTGTSGRDTFNVTGVGTHTVEWFSTDRFDNNEWAVTGLNSRSVEVGVIQTQSCGLLNLLTLLIAAILVLAILAMGFTGNLDLKLVVALIVMAVAGVICIVILGAVLVPWCGLP